MQWQARPMKELLRCAASISPVTVSWCGSMMMSVLPARQRQHCNMLMGTSGACAAHWQ